MLQVQTHDCASSHRQSHCATRASPDCFSVVLPLCADPLLLTFSLLCLCRVLPLSRGEGAVSNKPFALELRLWLKRVKEAEDDDEDGAGGAASSSSAAAASASDSSSARLLLFPLAVKIGARNMEKVQRQKLREREPVRSHATKAARSYAPLTPLALFLSLSVCSACRRATSIDRSSEFGSQRRRRPRAAEQMQAKQARQQASSRTRELQLQLPHLRVMQRRTMTTSLSQLSSPRPLVRARPQSPLPPSPVLLTSSK